MNLTKYSSLDLTTFTEGEVAWTKDEIISAAQSGQPEFVRRTRLDYDGPKKDLNSVLALADCVLDKVCAYLGVEGVEHTWALAPISQSNRDRLGRLRHNDHELLPAGYALVACVENVVDAQPVTPYWDDRIFDLEPSTVGIAIEDGKFVTNYDMRCGQFVMRPNRDDSRGHGSAVLVDIEPRLETQDC